MRNCDLDAVRRERRERLSWKNIAPLQYAVHTLPFIDAERIAVTLDDTVAIDIEALREEEADAIEKTARLLKPWRKGPFRISNLYIDSEWRSWIKYNLLEPFFDLRDKRVGDIGCNNAYYLFRMMKHEPAKLVGFDPSAHYFTQFQFIDRFVRSGIVYEMLGVEHVSFYEHRFDTLFCLGVLYHRPDPINTLKSLYKGLEKGGELILDTFMIDGDEEICLTPAERYSKIPNIYFIPTVNALKNWCMRAGFSDIEVLAVKETDTYEQRKTEWIDSQSLEDFLDPKNPSLTVEGYPAPKRVYIKAYKT
jgi:tRNA (mo5U34)-methyltransferase